LLHAKEKSENHECDVSHMQLRATESWRVECDGEHVGRSTLRCAGDVGDVSDGGDAGKNVSEPHATERRDLESAFGAL
jgi:hypothetical protein